MTLPSPPLLKWQQLCLGNPMTGELLQTPGSHWFSFGQFFETFSGFMVKQNETTKRHYSMVEKCEQIVIKELITEIQNCLITFGDR